MGKQNMDFDIALILTASSTNSFESDINLINQVEFQKPFENRLTLPFSKRKGLF